jgi:pimeloyl-ACP methyl ester carboxylesterase
MDPGSERRRAPTSGGELSYTDTGEGPPVLLLHGFPESSHVWRTGPTPRAWAIVPDAWHHESEKPADTPWD